jgi:hypothetical protein
MNALFVDAVTKAKSVILPLDLLTSSAFHKTNVESGKHWSLSALA